MAPLYNMFVLLSGSFETELVLEVQSDLSVSICSIGEKVKHKDQGQTVIQVQGCWSRPEVEIKERFSPPPHLAPPLTG